MDEPVRPLLERFLARQPASMQRVALVGHNPRFAPQFQPWGAAWRALCAEVGLTCPALLVELGDAMADVLPYIEVAGASYALLTPAESRDERAYLAQVAARLPAVASRAAMLPLFGEDGDLLLLDADGRVHAFEHHDEEPDRIVAASLDELLETASPGATNPA
jgi:hypothetical protein